MTFLISGFCLLYLPYLPPAHIATATDHLAGQVGPVGDTRELSVGFFAATQSWSSAGSGHSTEINRFLATASCSSVNRSHHGC